MLAMIVNRIRLLAKPRTISAAVFFMSLIALVFANPQSASATTVPNLSVPLVNAYPQSVSATTVPNLNLGLPWATGASGRMSSGCHSWGGGTGCSSVDFIPADGHVRAPADGIIKLEPNCANFVRIEIAGASGWSISLYHLKKIPSTVTSNTKITHGAYLGDISTEHGCGGSADAAHTHVTLWHNFSGFSGEASLNGIFIGGYKISTNGSYRQACMTDFLTGAAQCVTASASDPGPSITNHGNIGSGCPASGCAIRSKGNNLYVSSELGITGSRNGMLRARSSTIGSWERFDISGDCRSSSGCAIRSKANHLYTSTELGYAGAYLGMLRARSSTIGTWERYRLSGNCRSSTGCALIAIGNNKYVAAELNYAGLNNGMLRARSSTIGTWERFGIQ